MHISLALDAIDRFKTHFPSDADRIDLDGAERRVKELAAGKSPDHITASALVVDPRSRSLLLVWHDTLGQWLQPGGHVESADLSLIDAAKRELLEETSIEPSFLVFPFTRDCPFDVDVHFIHNEHRHRPHFHIDFRFVFYAEKPYSLALQSERPRIRWIDSAAATKALLTIDLQRTIRKLCDCGIMSQSKNIEGIP